MVLDDVCTEEMWFNLLRPFADATNGSRVILTTRHFNVASEADPWSSPLNLRQLTEEESWVLFLKNVGSRGSPENSSDLNNFREGILGICTQGLPPAILLLGGLLSTIELSDWSRVIDRSQFGEDKSAFLNIVALMSYNELPSALKPCFLYLALFPKAYEIPKRRLLQLWKYTNITTLPSSIWKAKKLRHLYMNEVSIQKPSRVVSSTNQLQTLMGLFIGSKDPKDCGLEKFTGLRKLELTCHSESTEETAKCISQLGSLLTLRLRSRDSFGQPLYLVLSPTKDHQSQWTYTK